MLATPPVDLMIVGAPKSGTTSLKSYLASHSDVVSHPQREFIYFADEERFRLGYDRVFREHFTSPWGGKRVVAKSVAMMYSEVSLQRLQESNPDVLVVMVLRDPVDRAYSEYWYARRRGWESASTFESAIGEAMAGRRGPATQKTSYVARGEYVRFVRTVLNHFPRDRVGTFTLQDLRESPDGVAGRLLERLGAGPSDLGDATRRRSNVGARARSEVLQRLIASPDRLSRLRRFARVLVPYRHRAGLKERVQRLNEAPFRPPEMNRDTREMLLDYYSPFNRELATVLDLDVRHWHGEDA